MAVLPTGIGPVTGYNIERSLRFNSADTAYLNRTPASASNRRTWTWSGWVKRGILNSSGGVAYPLFAVPTGATDSTWFEMRFISDFLYVAGYSTNWRITSQVFRDPSAWYHIVLAVDTTQATANDRLKLYVNGTQVTTFSTTNNPTQNADLGVNQAAATYIGFSNTQYFAGYLTEINFIDGQAKTPSDFGETDASTGVWKPKAYTGTYGTNGFFLKFADNSNTTAATLGKDSSGNGNNWTPNNFSVTAGAGNDSLVDTPTSYGTDTGAGGEVRGNYATLNPIYVIPSNTTTSFTNGNLNFSVTQAEGTGTASAVTTMPLPTSGKWYWEITPTTVATLSASRTQIGIMAQSQINFAMANGPSGTPGSTGQCFAYAANGQKNNDATLTNYGNSYTANDVIGVAVDLDNNAIYFAKNGTWQNSGVPTSGASKTGAAYTTLAGSNNYFPAVGYWGTFVANFGQRAFAYTAPSGFKALCTQNLPTPTIGATSTTQANDYFDVKTWSGNSSTQSIPLEFAPDLIWNKSRNNASNHAWWDVLRGTGAVISSSTTEAETTGYNAITSFSSNAISLGPDNTGVNNGRTNETGRTYVGWVWNAGDSTVTNTSGTISAQVRASTTSGFSIVTYTGTGANATVGHGLGVAPSMIIVKNRTFGGSWRVYHSSLGNTQNVRLNLTNATATDSGIWNNTSPTSSVFTVGTDADVNRSGDAHVAYCFAPVAGYSAFGSYTGNGSTDGPFVYTGFRPKYVMIKNSTTGGAGYDWFVWDSVRDTYNLTTLDLNPNSSQAENTNSGDGLDILSNGFKIRVSTAATNTSGNTFIYACFAESPFKYSLAR
jgi:hypothetical protein